MPGNLFPIQGINNVPVLITQADFEACCCECPKYPIKLYITGGYYNDGGEKPSQCKYRSLELQAKDANNTRVFLWRCRTDPTIAKIVGGYFPSSGTTSSDWCAPVLVNTFLTELSPDFTVTIQDATISPQPFSKTVINKMDTAGGDWHCCVKYDDGGYTDSTISCPDGSGCGGVWAGTQGVWCYGVAGNKVGYCDLDVP